MYSNGEILSGLEEVVLILRCNEFVFLYLNVVVVEMDGDSKLGLFS